jgi:GT2 family glycosyltransferase
MTHPEIEYAPDAILRMRAYLDEHPEVAVCTPKLLRAFAHSFGDDGQPHIEHSLVIDSTGLVLTKSRQIKQRGAGEEDRGQYETTTEIFGGNGMCTLFRASALQAVRQGEEWFDEDFETGHEDGDLAWRLRRFGFRTMYLPEAVAWRWCQRPPEAKKWFVKTLHRAASFDSSQRARLLRNTVWMLVKNDDVGRLCAHVLWWIVPAISGVVRGACSLSGWKEGIHALLGLPQMFAKRKRLKQDALVKGAAMKKWFV